jgi:transcriptional regulator with XRE-family HTH domain
MPYHRAFMLGVFYKLAASGKGSPLWQFYQSDTVSLSASIHMAQLPNYLRSNRKRLALSQDEVAFLLGTQSGAKMCRYERFVREPSLETAMAFEVIFQRSASELFGGLYEKVEQKVMARAKALAERTDRQKARRRTAHKRRILNNIANNVLNQ